MGTVHRRLADRALTLGAALGLAALLLTTLGAVSGVRPLVFRSGSMAPTIGTGALALAHRVEAGDLHPGDIVSVRTASGARVTHRVVRVDRSSDRLLLTLKGDANQVADAENYAGDSAYRVFWHVPWLGYAVWAMGSPRGALVLALVATVILLLPRRPSSSPSRRRRARRRHPGRHRRSVAVAAVATAGVLSGQGPASAAAWSDQVDVGGVSLTAGSVSAPVLSCGSVGVLSVPLSWTAVAGATSYTLHYGSGGAQTLTTATTAVTLVAAITGGTAWVVANHDYGSTTWSSVASNSRTYTVAVVSFCG